MGPSEFPSALSVSWGFLLPVPQVDERPLTRSSRGIVNLTGLACLIRAFGLVQIVHVQ
jgi:hypothetical protein